MTEILVSFVHGYLNDDLFLDGDHVPCLVSIDADSRKINQFYSLPFPRTPKDFAAEEIHDLLVGEAPIRSTKLEFKKLPRFGVMGLSQSEEKIYAATWNGIYVLHKNDMSTDKFISHRLINDPHGIQVVGDKVYSVLTALDMVVVTDISEGRIVDYFSIDRELKISRDSEVVDFDWRFISKQHRGAVGNWHFNHIRIEGSKLLLTSRLTSCVVEVDLETESVCLRTVCWDTPVMLHDGRAFPDGSVVFTSVDGKILIAKPAGVGGVGISSMNDKEFHRLMKRDMVNTSIRLGEILNRQVNWCRGIEQIGDYYITTTDGRYDQEQPFFSVTFVSKDGGDISFIRIPYDLVKFPEVVRYLTGFSIMELQ